MARLVAELGYPTSRADTKRRFEKIFVDSSYTTLLAERGETVIGMAAIHIEHTNEANEIAPGSRRSWSAPGAVVRVWGGL